MLYKSTSGSSVAVCTCASAVPVDKSAVYNYAPLPVDLVTGNQKIDVEHQILLNSMLILRHVCRDFATRQDCRGCTPGERHECESSLVSLLGDLLVFIMDHFRAEEQLMRDSLLMMADRALCEAHIKDHAAISGKVQQIVAALDPMHTPARIRELDALLQTWVKNHVAVHDYGLARWVEREDSVLRKADPVAR
jgi:hemerythrin-like metal-binding protein